MANGIEKDSNACRNGDREMRHLGGEGSRKGRKKGKGSCRRAWTAERGVRRGQGAGMERKGRKRERKRKKTAAQHRARIKRPSSRGARRG